MIHSILVISISVLAMGQQSRIVDIYTDAFYQEKKEVFAIPDYEFDKEYQLVKINDEDLLTILSQSLGYDFHYDAECYFFTHENRLPDLQDFTIYYRHPDGYHICYCIFDNDNTLINHIDLAYQFAMGEYAEDAHGNFIENNKYSIEIVGMAAPYEEPDGTIYEGEETHSEIIYVIEPDGTIRQE